jgi:membrane-associated phospholipid phosphatase
MEIQTDGHSAAVADAPDQRAESKLTRRILMGAAIAYVVVTFTLVALFGKLLLSRDVVLLWLAGGLLILSLNNPRRWVRGMIIDWAPFVLFLFAYDYARSIADNTGFGAHYHPQIDVDKFLFGTPIPTIFLQHHLYHPPHAAVYDYAAWGVYLTHFFGTVVLAAILWRFAHPLFKKWRTLVIWLSTAGFTTYVLFPAAPPWLAAQRDLIGHIEKIKDQMFTHTGTKAITSAIENNWVDKVAAVPSLHAAFPFMMMLLFWHKGWKWRIPFAAYAFAMGLTLVYTGEHYASDVLLGWVYAGVVFTLCTLWWRRRAARAAKVKAPIATETAAPVPSQAPAEPEPVTYSVGPAAQPGRTRSG